MKTLENEQDKIQKICDALRKQTLEPAQAEAEKIIQAGHARAEQIVQEARQQSDQLLAEARKKIERERNVFESSLSQASKQSIEALKQAIEHQLFTPELHDQIVKNTTDPKVIASLITSIVSAIEKEGLGVDLNAYVPASVPAQQVNALLAKEIINKLNGKSVALANFAGGAKIRVEGKNITLDISNTEIEELIQRYVRKDFRKLLFGNHNS